MKRGISLVALVITIIVLIILTATVMIMFNQDGILGKAEEAVFKSDFSNILESYTNKKNNLMLENLEDIVITDVQGSNLENYIPILQGNNKQIKEKHYEDLIFIKDSKIYQRNDINDEEIEKWLEEVGIPKENDNENTNENEIGKKYLLNEKNIQNYSDTWKYSENPYGQKSITVNQNNKMLMQLINSDMNGSYGAHILLATKEKIDMTNYDKIVVQFDDIQLQGTNNFNKTLAYLYLDSQSNSWTSNPNNTYMVLTNETGAKTLELDVSQVSGEYYICIGANSPKANSINTVQVYLSSVYMQ